LGELLAFSYQICIQRTPLTTTRMLLRRHL